MHIKCGRLMTVVSTDCETAEVNVPAQGIVEFAHDGGLVAQSYCWILSEGMRPACQKALE